MSSAKVSVGPSVGMSEYFAMRLDGIGDPSAVDDNDFSTQPSVQSITQNMTRYQGFPEFQNLQSFEVEKALQNLNVRKSTGWDGIPLMTLKLGATELTNPLISLFNSSIAVSHGPWDGKRVNGHQFLRRKISMKWETTEP